MTDMRRIVVYLFLVTFIPDGSVLVLPQGQQPQKAAPTAPARAKPGQAGSQRELDAYNKLHNEVDPADKKSLIDKFAADYPLSGLLAYVYQDGVYLGRQANNIEMMSDYGDKSLDLWPDNYTLLTELGSVYVRRNRVDEAETEATRALELVAAAPKPAGMTEPQWTENKKMLLASNYSTLGFVHLRRAQAAPEVELKTGETENAIVSFRKALENHPIDDFAFYGLGFAFAIQNDYPNAESNLAKAVAVNGIVMASARSFLEEIYKSQHRQSLNGLDQVIAKAKAELGLY
jgi:tetratricopeptide (TPR) repeat protein